MKFAQFIFTVTFLTLSRLTFSVYAVVTVLCNWQKLWLLVCAVWQ